MRASLFDSDIIVYRGALIGFSVPISYNEARAEETGIMRGDSLWQWSFNAIVSR